MSLGMEDAAGAGDGMMFGDADLAARHDQHRNRAELVVGRKRIEHVESAHARKAEIENDRGRRLRPSHRQPLLAAGGKIRLEADLSGHAVKQLAGIVVILDDQDITLQPPRSEEHTSELQSLMRISYAVFC